ncbi:MAG: flagellar basal body rod protein FlgG [Bacillus sp. (in: firmicutes)]
MLRSMYSGISGMKNFQTKLDVIGNNISNVNTYGYKKGRVIFSDLISQTSGGASAPTAERGGINPMQVGLGAKLAAIDTMHTEGSTQTTNRVLDLAISGDGFFVVGDPASGDFSYTRAGNMYLDTDGNLVNGEGLYVLGSTVAVHPADGTLNGEGVIKIPLDAQSMSIGKDGSVTYLDGNGTLQTAGKIILAKFNNASGLEKVGGNQYKPTSNSGLPVYNYAENLGIGKVNSSMLEMSNVDLSEEFTEMIVAQRGFQANTRIITTSDEILQELINLKR